MNVSNTNRLCKRSVDGLGIEKEDVKKRKLGKVNAFKNIVDLKITQLPIKDPIKVYRYIFNFLPYQSLGRMAQICKYFKSTVDDIWKYKCKKELHLDPEEKPSVTINFNDLYHSNEFKLFYTDKPTFERTLYIRNSVDGRKVPLQINYTKEGIKGYHLKCMVIAQLIHFKIFQEEKKDHKRIKLTCKQLCGEMNIKIRLLGKTREIRDNESLVLAEIEEEDSLGYCCEKNT